MRTSQLIRISCPIAAALVSGVVAHGDPAANAEAQKAQTYAERHMVSEHHINAFDVKSFFTLHDFDRDGFWSRDEIEAVYGVHHPYAKEKSGGEAEHDEKARQITKAVLDIMDKDKDGRVSLAEFEAVGLAGLPDFTKLGAEGHHYDVESEFFLHHEEVYHNTPETQADEAYTHPEDIEHFKHHEKIELEEENKEREYQGLPPLASLPPDAQPTGGAQHDKTPLEEAREEAAIKNQDPNHVVPMDGHGNVVAEEGKQPSHMDLPNPRYTRVPKDSRLDLSSMQDGSQKPAYGAGPEGYQRPKDPNERLRRNLPYKYKFRRSWGDF